MPLILTKLEDHIGTIILNHPKKLNSIGDKLVDEFIAAFDVMEQANARVVIIRAQPGIRIWSAGHDVSELPDGNRDPLGYADSLERLLRCIQDFPMPVIAMAEGGVWGGAVNVCISCDMVFCAENTTFAITPARLGLPYNASGLVHFLNVLGPAKTKEMFFTAQPISAQEALEADMVNHVLLAEELETFTYGVATTIANNAPLAVRVLKRQFRLLLQGQMLSSEIFERIQGMRREVYDSQDYREGIKAFKEKRKPDFTGS